MVKLASLNPFSRKAKPASDLSRPYRVLFTRGDELLTPTAYRGAFEQALSRSLTNTSEVADEFVMRAFAVSVTAHICTEYRASKTAGIPLKVVDGLGSALEATPLTHFLKQSPNILQDWTRSHLIFGRTYLRKRYNARGYPTELRWVNPLDVYEYTERQRVIGYRITNADGTREDVKTSEVVYAQAFDARPGGNGLSKFEAAWLPLTGEQSLSTHSAAFFVNSARPDGFLTFDEPLSPDEYDEAKKEWRANFQGAKNSHKTAVMPGGARWTSITIPPNDLAMQELKSIYREDICGLFDVDPILVGLAPTSDPLSANSTFGTKETAHIRGVTLPFVETVILPALNNQWALSDFDRRDYYHLEVDTMAIPALVESQLVKADTSIHLSDAKVLDYAESRELLGMEARDGYFLRKPDDAKDVFAASGLTLNQFHQLVFGQAPLGINGDVILMGGQFIPAARLMEVANANVEKLKLPPATPFGGGFTPPGTGGVTVTTPPIAPPAPALPPGRTDTTRSLFVGLHFPNHPDLIGLQNRLKQSFADQQVEWNDPTDFHTTVLYAPDVDDTQAAAFVRALSSLDVPADLTLRVGSLNSFDNVGEHALHFRIRRNGDLLDTQAELYDAARGLDIGLSAFSDPMAYKAHITMGYCAERPRAVTFHSALTLQPTALRVMRGDKLLYERSLQVPMLTRAALPPEPMQLEAAVSLADNQFVRYSRRILADALSSQGIAAQWVGEPEWRLVLAQASEWTPAALASLIRSADYTETQHIDVRLNGFTQDGDGLFALVDGNIDTLRKAVGLELRGVGLTSDSVIAGVRLATVAQTVDTLPSVDFPIVLNNVSLYLGGQPYHQWALRSGSAAQFTELKNWEHVTRRKGASHAFRTETLPRWIADYVQTALSEGESIDAVFTLARTALSGDSSAAEQVKKKSIKDLIGATPAEYASYWHDYDGLMSRIASDWLDHYVKQATDTLGQVKGKPDVNQIMDALNQHQDELVNTWVGTKDTPGVLTQMMLAGMAAGNQSLIQHSSINPSRAAVFEVDWDLLAQQAYDFARNYAYDLIRRLNDTTRQRIQDAIALWLQQGQSLTALTDQLTTVVNDPSRAALIAQTETTRIYNAGAQKRWEQVGVSKARFQTVSDGHVCPICAPLHNTESTLDVGWRNSEGSLSIPPMHPGCRCFMRPIVDVPTKEAIAAQAQDVLDLLGD